MLVLCLSKCPPALRGDLTRWLQQIDTGVYAGHVSARIREALWERVVENIKDGRATMVYTVKNEQRLEFCVHNSEWTPVDFDGMKLMLRPHKNAVQTQEHARQKTGYSAAAALRSAKKYGSRSQSASHPSGRYAVIDIETSGLSALSDRIIEIGAIQVEDGAVTGRWESLVKCERPLPPAIVALTRITDEMLLENGADEATALRDLLAFVKDWPLVLHNAGFDLSFLRQGCKRCNLPMPANAITDTVALAKRSIDDIDDFKLGTLASYFGIDASGAHRSMEDCLLTSLVYEKLIEKAGWKI